MSAPFDVAPVLRPYQVEAVEQVEQAWAAGARSPLLQLATGSGKTVIAGELIRREVEAGGSVLFLAPRRELVYQTSEKLTAVDVRHSILMAGEDDEDAWAPCTVASIDTLRSRLIQGRSPFMEPTLVVVDEAHLSITQVRQRIIESWPEARILGLTATPGRKDGKALGIIYDPLLEPVTVAELTEQGYLVPVRYFSLSEPDLSRVGTVAGDYNLGQLEDAVNRAELVADVIQTWLARAAGRRTVVFACSISHSVALSDEFQRSGVKAEHVDAGTPHKQRRAIFDRFRSGECQVLTNCFLASYGFDLPDLGCVVLARPTKSLVLYLQMLGRGLRPAEGKDDCLVLDHSGAVHRHGFAADPRFWALEGSHMLKPPARRGVEFKEEKRITCPECAAVFTGSRVCPECGFELRPKGREVQTLDGELVEVGAGLETEEVDRRCFFAELRGIGQEKGYKQGWAAHKFKERFGAFPPFDWNHWSPQEPSLETRRWVKSRTIAWAKAQQKARASA